MEKTRYDGNDKGRKSIILISGSGSQYVWKSLDFVQKWKTVVKKGER